MFGFGCLDLAQVRAEVIGFGNTFAYVLYLAQKVFVVLRVFGVLSKLFCDM